MKPIRRLAPRPLALATRLAAGASLAASLTFAGCVTRTVYVVDDSPRPTPAPIASTPAPAPAPVAEADRAAEEDVPPMPAPSRAAPEPMVEEDAPSTVPQNVAAVDDFYEPLSPYGQWVEYPGYGRVFVPSQAYTGAGFRPYTYGHWEYTEFGWTWVDHSPFGWATGHYGRWFYDGSYGWVWVPGTQWAPAWVAWRTGGAYAGWAPLPPGAEFGGAYTVYDTSWVFVPYGALGAAYVGSAIIVGPGYHTCFVETYPAYDTVVYYGNTYYAGPSYDDVEHHGGHVIHRPARDIDREHPTSAPPPSSHVRTRPASTSTSRPRTGTASGRPETARQHAADERNGANDTHPSSRDGNAHHDRGRADPAADDARGTPAGTRGDAR